MILILPNLISFLVRSIENTVRGERPTITVTERQGSACLTNSRGSVYLSSIPDCHIVTVSCGTSYSVCHYLRVNARYFQWFGHFAICSNGAWWRRSMSYAMFSLIGMEITDAQKEREAIAALRDAESRVNHSVCWRRMILQLKFLVISRNWSSPYSSKPLLISRSTHPTEWSSISVSPWFLRIGQSILSLVYNLAEEYASSKDYEKALK